jgi:diamine N-acetyltransferase
MLLRPLKKEDAKYMHEWMTDPAVNQFFRFDKSNITIKKCQDFIKNSFTDTDRNYAIEEDGEYQGTISLKHIDSKNKTAEYAIALRKSAQGKGLGTRASKELLNIAFTELKLNKVYLDVLSDNTAAIHLYQKIGFKQEGELKSHIIIDNKPRDLKLFGIQRSEYEKL